MKNSLKCQSLFTFKSDFFKSIFSEFEYPWDILSHIEEIIDRIIRRGIEGYSLVDTSILLGPGVSVDDCVSISGPAIIGSGSKLRHGAYIRGGVIIGNECVIGNSSEVKNSILMDRAQAPHFNYIGDSILGEGAHLGAGAICSNLRSDGKSVQIKSDGICIDTGRRKLGAILGDNVEIGCGAVLCPGTVIGKNSSVYPLTLAKNTYPCNSIVKNDCTVSKKNT